MTLQTFASAEHAAGILADLRVRVPGSTVLGALPEVCRPVSMLDGYHIQRRVRELLSFRAPGGQVGWKIGATTPVIQKYLKVPHPIAGTLYQNWVQRSEAVVESSGFFRLGLECEIAVELTADLPQRDDVYDRDSVRHAVGLAMVSVELIEHRFKDVSEVGAATLIADDALSAGCVLGEPVPVETLSDLATLRGGFSVDDALPVQTGVGAAVQGHPLNALAWLATLAAGLGTPLMAGQVVSLGSLIDILYPSVGQTIEARIDRLPPVTIKIA